MSAEINRLIGRRLKNSMTDKYKEPGWIWHRYEMRVLQPGVSFSGDPETMEIELLYRRYKVIRATKGENSIIVGEIPQANVVPAPDRFINIDNNAHVYCWPTETLARQAFIDIATRTAAIWETRAEQYKTVLGILAEFVPGENDGSDDEEGD